MIDWLLLKAEEGASRAAAASYVEGNPEPLVDDENLPHEPQSARSVSVVNNETPAPVGVVGRVLNAVWDRAKDLTARGTSLARGQAKVAGKALVASVMDGLTAQSNPLLDELAKALSALKNSRENPFTEEQRRELAQKLTLFKEESEQILTNTFETDESEAVLTAAQNETIESLVRVLTAPDEEVLGELLDNVYTIVTHFRDLQMGWVQMGTEALKVQGAAQFKKVLALSETETASRRTIEESRSARRELQMRMVRPEEQRQMPQDKMAAIKGKCSELIDLSKKIALIKILFPNDAILKIFPELLTVAHRLRESDAQISLDQAFRSAVELKFNENGTSFLKKAAFFFHLHFTSPILEFYIGRSLVQLQSDLLNFLSKKPDARMEDIFALVVKPLQSHLSIFQSKLIKLDREAVLQGSIEEQITEFFQKMAFDGKNNATRANELARVLIEKYTPNLSITGKFRQILNGFFPVTKYRVLNAILGFFKSSIMGVIYVAFAPIQWTINQLIKGVIRIVATRRLLPTFFQTTQDALGVGASYQHTLNIFIKQKLEGFNRNVVDDNFQMAMPLKSSLNEQNEMKALVLQLFKTLELQKAMQNPISLHHYFAPNMSPEMAKQWINELIAKGITPTATIEILKFIEYFLQEEFLSEVVWHALDNLTSLLKTPFEEVPQEIKASTEASMLEEFEEAIVHVVERVVQKTLNPTQQINVETEADIEELKRAANRFIVSCQTVDQVSFILVEESWRKLVRDLTTLMNKLTKTKIEPLVKLSTTLGKNFSAATGKFNQIINEIRNLIEDKNRVEGQTRLIEQKFNQLKAELGKLTEWKESLQTVKIPLKDVTIFKILQAAGPTLESYLVDKSMQHVNALLSTTTKPYHWTGIMWKMADAYIRRPSNLDAAPKVDVHPVLQVHEENRRFDPPERKREIDEVKEE